MSSSPVRHPLGVFHNLPADLETIVEVYCCESDSDILNIFARFSILVDE